MEEILRIKKIEQSQKQMKEQIIRLEGIIKEKDFDYEKIVATIKYLYRYYDDMNKDKTIDIT
jgi:hypothetical protein